jgi:protein-S-isoprenylcysteine O-methyltransferase Ste14
MPPRRNPAAAPFIGQTNPFLGKHAFLGKAEGSMRTLLVGLVLLALGVAAVVASEYGAPPSTLGVCGFILAIAGLVAILRAWEKRRR